MFALRRDIAPADHIHLARELARTTQKHNPLQPSRTFLPKVSEALVAPPLSKICSSLRLYSVCASRDEEAKRPHKLALHLLAGSICQTRAMQSKLHFETQCCLHVCSSASQNV